MESTLIFSGIVVSLLVQYMKTSFNLATTGTLLLVSGLSLVGAGGYFMLQKYGMLDSFLQIMTVAGAFYTFILKNALKDSTTE